MIRPIPRLCALFFAVGLVPMPASAASDLGDLVSIEVLDGGQTARGTHQAALRVVLADGWKTYWRSPGDAGIAPQFEWDGSQNVEDISISWPTPQVSDQYGMRTFVYQRQMVLPLEITAIRPDQPMRLKGVIQFGMCQEVCVPASLSFDMPLDPKSSRNPTIAAALAERPYSAAEAGVLETTCLLTASDQGMTFKAVVTMPPAGASELAVIEPGDDQIWASSASAQRQGDTLTVVSELDHVSGSDFTLDFAAVRITVLGQNYGVDILGCTPG